MTEFEVPCKFGPHTIKMVGSKETGWKPMNLDNTPHNCRDKRNQEKQKPTQPGQTAILSPAFEMAVRKITREEIEKWYNGTQVE